MDGGILSGLGLAAPAGINAPLTLLLVALADRFTGFADLPADWDWLSSWPAIGALAVLLAIEEVVDKIPGLDHVNDAVQTALRPSAGAVVMLASTSGDLPPAVAAVLGLALAGTAHATKAGARPVVTLGTAGLGNPVVSVVEDAIAFIAVVLALVVPVMAVLIVLALLAAAVAVAVTRRRRRRARRAETAAPG
ncbi:MAG TPA: DUF4126 domain-containing protein [Solirubrobacteraceae bacterium]|nr:DUF4126 domain-containing protein [Solirubrobacteraceae bacterium]